MGRTHDIIRFVEYEEGSNLVIEPRQRHQHVRERLLDVVKTYNPRVIVKAGLGRGELLLDLASSSDAVIVVVDYSCDAMNRFRQAHRDTSVLERVHFVAGDFSSFPVDYYAADLLLCVDYFDFIETGTAIDEFRRSLQFEGILFIADDVLHEEDLNGAYDDLTAMLFPLHNDYYLESDLKTFLSLNEFRFVKGDVASFALDLNAITDHYSGFSPVGHDRVSAYIDEQRATLSSLYSMEDGTFTVPYFIGVFMREKIK